MMGTTLLSTIVSWGCEREVIWSSERLVLYRDSTGFFFLFFLFFLVFVVVVVIVVVVVVVVVVVDGGGVGGGYG